MNLVWFYLGCFKESFINVSVVERKAICLYCERLADSSTVRCFDRCGGMILTLPTQRNTGVTDWRRQSDMTKVTKETCDLVWSAKIVDLQTRTNSPHLRILKIESSRIKLGI
jgi:hypothetical protein